jgi:hypothetical protein
MYRLVFIGSGFTRTIFARETKDACLAKLRSAYSELHIFEDPDLAGNFDIVAGTEMDQFALEPVGA